MKKKKFKLKYGLGVKLTNFIIKTKKKGKKKNKTTTTSKRLPQTTFIFQHQCFTNYIKN